MLLKLRGVKVDANDYARFSKIQDDEEGKAAEEAKEDVAHKQIQMLAEYLPESEQKQIVEAATYEEKVWMHFISKAPQRPENCPKRSSYCYQR